MCMCAYVCLHMFFYAYTSIMHTAHFGISCNFREWNFFSLNIRTFRLQHKNKIWKIFFFFFPFLVNSESHQFSNSQKGTFKFFALRKVHILEIFSCFLSCIQLDHHHHRRHFINNKNINTSTNIIFHIIIKIHIIISTFIISIIWGNELTTLTNALIGIV